MPPERVTGSVCSGDPEVPVPLQIFTVTVAESPAALPALPASVGVVSFVAEPSAGEVSVTAGGVVSPLEHCAVRLTVPSR